MPNTLPAMLPYLPASLVLIGLVIHVAALAPLYKLIAILPAGSLRNKWLAMAGLVFFFIAGYFGFLVELWGQQSEWHELPISCIFLIGALFVWLTIKLSLQTAVDLRRIVLLESENITDPLTGVYNRRYLDQHLAEEVARSRRYSLNLSVLILDIDHFKHVNDTYGHQAGDVALSAIGSLVKAALRNSDVIARYGGEEFLVICTNTAIHEAALVADRIRHLVESHQIRISGDSGGNQTIQVSISIGAAGLSAGFDSREKMVHAADQALYRAKREGRNRVIVAAAEAGESAIPEPGFTGNSASSPGMDINR